MKLPHIDRRGKHPVLTHSLALIALTAPQERETLAHEAYRAQMAAAESAMRLGEHADARGWLDATAPERRGFEWRVRDAELDQALFAWPVEGGVAALAVSPDGRTLACGRGDGTLALHDAETFAVLARVTAHAEPITQVRFDRAGARLVTCSYDRTVKVWRASDLTLATEFKGHGFPVGGADFSPDGRLVASCSYERPPDAVVGTLHLWDAADGSLVRTMEGGRKPLVSLSFSPDGRSIAAGSWDFCVFAWDAGGGAPRQLDVPDEGIYNAVDGVAWSPDGAWVAGASKDRTARVWNPATGALVATLRGHTDDVAKLAFSPDGSVLGTASRDGTLKLWNTDDWSERATLLGHADDVVGLAFSPDGTRLWSCAGDDTVRVWDATTTWYAGAGARPSDACYVVRFSPDGHRLASCTFEGRVQVWSADTLELLAAWQAHPAEESCHALDWSPDGRRLYSGSHDGTVGIWDSVTQEERGRLAHAEGLYWLDVSPDGRLLATVSGGKVFVWDLAEARRVTTFEVHESSVLHVSFSPDSKLCVSSGRDGKAIVWEAESGAVRFDVTGVGANVAASLFTADGAYVVVGGRAGHVALHRASDGAKVRDLVRNRHGFSHLALSPDGSRVVLASEAVTLVDLRLGGAVGRLRPHVDHPYNAAFDPAGERLASCSTDGSIAVADTAPLRARLARAAAMRRLALLVEPEVGPTPSVAAIGAVADRVWVDESASATERAARIEVLTRRAAELARRAPAVSAQDPLAAPDGPPNAPLFFTATVAGNSDVYWSVGGETQRLTSDPGTDNFPVPSPDGKWVAFQSQRDGSYDVFVVPRDGSAPPRKLASGDAHDGLPVWSPDGTELAFFSNRGLPPPEPRTLPGHMYRVRFDGSGLRRLTQAPLSSTVGPAAWSRDGHGLFFSRRRDGSGLDLFRYDLDTGAERALGAGPEDEYGAELSPDGKLLAFYQETGTRCDVAVMELDGSGRRTLTSDPGWHYVQSWSPDGEWLAVLSYSADYKTSRTFALRLSDGHTAPLETLPGARELRWALR